MIIAVIVFARVLGSAAAQGVVDHFQWQSHEGHHNRDHERRDDEFENHFVDDVIMEDIGEGTDGWEFPGASYSVEIR